MRYRAYFDGSEKTLAAMYFLLGLGSVMLQARHSDHTIWGYAGFVPGCMMLAMPLLTLWKYRAAYVDLGPDALDLRRLWRHSTISYSQIDRVLPVERRRSQARGIVVELWLMNAKKLIFTVDDRTAFLEDLHKHAPQASFEEPTVR
jgi:hypothetical protein